jgi:choline dehydrogenase-like flavoprotein
MQLLASVGSAILNLWGLFRVPQYDAIIVGGGAAGCPLAQTLVEEGLRVLVVERGLERTPETYDRKNANAAFRTRCADKILTDDGVVVAAGTKF